ncbi:MAG: hypothetical protein OYH77_02940 [Pseudomonadota bacterium]|nr:hypothetical protein [Pseudomonadota bacterium]
MPTPKQNLVFTQCADRISQNEIKINRETASIHTEKICYGWLVSVYPRSTG